MTIKPENQQVSDADESSLEAEFAARRAARLGGDAEPAAEAEPSEAERAESQVPAEANQEPAKTQGDLKPAEPSGKSSVEEDRAARLERELEEARRNYERLAGKVKPLQQKLASLERQSFNPGGTSKPTPGAKPADSATVDPSELLASPDIKRALADFPEVKPIVDAIARQNATLAAKLAETERVLQSYAQRLEQEVLPSVSSLASDWETSRFQAKVQDLTSAFPDWSKHYSARLIPSIDPETGEPTEVPVDAKMSPQFAAWLFQQPEEIAALRFSPDPSEVKRMWAKFAQDTASAPAPTPAALPQERTQRLAASAAPNVKPSPQPARVNWEDMSPEEQFAYRRKLRKSGAS